MEISFKQPEAEPESITFEHIAKDRFFVKDGCLCQKVNENTYIVIADTQGKPWASYSGGATRAMSVQRILPKVTRIEF